METVLVVLTVLISVLMIILVLIQKSKGGGLSSSFAGSNQIMGVRRTTDFVEKATWTLAIIIMVLAVASTLIASSHTTAKGNSSIKPVDIEQVPVAAPIDYATPAAATADDAVVAVEEQTVAVAETATEN